MSTPASTGITRKTTIKQVLDISVDLGPINEASHIPKLRVVRKRDAQEMFINEHEFGVDEIDPLTRKVSKRFRYGPTHYSVVEDFDPDIESAHVACEKVISLYSPEDLATMKIAELKRVPEYSRIEIRERRKLKTKQDYVDAILAQRKPSEVRDEAPPKTGKRAKREAIGS